MLKKVVAFVDGENLCARFEAMKKNSFLPRDDVIHLDGSFVWSPLVTRWTDMDLVRVSYYTSVVGDSAKVARVEQAIASTRYSCQGAGMEGTASLLPRVNKKENGDRKEKTIDVALTVDAMRAALTMPVDAIFVLSGDGDFAPLLREITRTTEKQVYVGNFSDGRSPLLGQCAEQFVDLDERFFRT